MGNRLSRDVLFSDTLWNGAQVDHFSLKSLSFPSHVQHERMHYLSGRILRSKAKRVSNKKQERKCQLIPPSNKFLKQGSLSFIYLLRIKYQNMVVTETQVKSFIWTEKWSQTFFIMKVNLICLTAEQFYQWFQGRQWSSNKWTVLTKTCLRHSIKRFYQEKSFWHRYIEINNI